jgi:hypothetical protein
VSTAKLVIVLSVAALAAAVGAVVLSEAPAQVVRGNGSNANMGFTTGRFGACQAGEVLPRGVSAIRVGVAANLGPLVTVNVYSGSDVVARGSHPPNWTGRSVTVSLTPLNRSVSMTKLCIAVGPNSEPVYIYGRDTPTGFAATSAEGQKLPGRVGVEYLAPGRGSWWSRALLVARHMGIGHAFSGSWVALLLALLVGGVVALTVRLAWQEMP